MNTATHLTGTTLILGGARSGKSAYAETLVLTAQLRPIYIATGQAHDEEMRARITHHQQRRSDIWTTHEEPLALCEMLEKHASPATAVLVDCLTLWLSNLMMADKNIDAETNQLVALIPGLAGPVVFVSNEVGMGLVPETPLGRDFRDHAGRLNQRVAEATNTVRFIVAGLALPLKTTQKK